MIMRLLTFASRGRLAVLILVLGCLAASADPAPPTVEEIAEAFAIEGNLDAIDRGELVGGDLRAVSDNELAIAVATASERTTPWLWQRLLTARGLDTEPAIIEWGEIGDDVVATLRRLTLPDSEVEKLAEAEPGEDANFASDEIAQLRRAAKTEGKSARREALLEALRKILALRLEAYRSGGLASISAYDRGDGDTSPPAAQLERAFEEVRVTRRLAPPVYDAMAAHPKPPPEGVESRFYWMVHEANDRPVVALAHRVFGQHDGNGVAIERRFYVHHTLNSMQSVYVAVPVETGSVLIYANRTGTDLVTGFGSSVAKGIARKLMRSQIHELLEDFAEAAGDR
jgi:hypothetical protein